MGRWSDGGLMELARERHPKTYAHFVDTSAALIASAPIFGAYEVLGPGMSDSESLMSRLGVAGFSYFLYLGTIYSKGRDLSQFLTRVKNVASETVKGVHDTAYGIAFNIALTPPLYKYVSGLQDPEQIAAGAAAIAIPTIISSYFVGRAIDVGRDLAGIAPSDRTPQFVRDWSPKKKLQAITRGLVATTAVTAGMLFMIPDEMQKNRVGESIEPLVEMLEPYADAWPDYNLPWHPDD